MEPVKPGYKTTEFWLSLLAIVIAALTASGVFAPGSAVAKVIAVVGSILVAMGYTSARKSAKSEPPGA